MLLTPAIIVLVAIFTALLLLRFGAAHRQSAARFTPAIIIAMAAILFAARGRMLLALIFGIGAAALYVWSRRPAAKPHEAAQGGAGMSDAQARAILGVPPGATESDIRTAFRRRMQTAHPDQGGSTEEAARLSAARDALLRR